MFLLHEFKHKLILCVCVYTHTVFSGMHSRTHKLSCPPSNAYSPLWVKKTVQSLLIIAKLSLRKGKNWWHHRSNWLSQAIVTVSPWLYGRGWTAEAGQQRPSAFPQTFIHVTFHPQPPEPSDYTRSIMLEQTDVAERDCTFLRTELLLHFVGAETTHCSHRPLSWVSLSCLPHFHLPENK